MTHPRSLTASLSCASPVQKERLRQEIAEKGIQRTWEEHFDKRYNRTYYFNRATQESVWEIPTSNTTLDPYDNDLVMPLREWIEHPTAQEFIHDASALQLLGITNNSFWPTAPAVRRCYFEDDAARAELMALAKERLEIVHHVGLTEKLEDSVASLAASMGVSLGNGTAYKSVPKGALAYDAPGFDDSALVKYNKTVVDPAGEEVELSILEARRTLVNLMQNATGLHTKLNDLEPKLEDLVTQEEAWLDEQDAKYAATLRGRIEAQWRWVKEWVRNVTGIAAGEDGSEIQEVDDEGPEEVIDSPWADQIVELDAQVYELQQKLQRVEADMESLRAIPEVKGPEEPAGPAKFIMGDEEYKETLKVGRYYLKCAKEATNRAKNKRTKAFKHLRNLNEESFMFTSEARQAVYKTDIADRIRELNPADDAMFWRGQELLASSIERQKAAGTYEEMIKWPPKPPTPPPEVVGEEAVEGDEDAAELAEAAEDASSAGSAEDANKAVSETDPPSEDFSEEENMHSEL